MESKPIGWHNMLKDLINANKNYEDTNATLKKQFGSAGTLSGNTYRELKSELTGGEKVDEKIGEMKERLRQPTKEKKLPPWTKQKQTAADTSKLAEIINMGIFQGMMPFCANKKLEEQHVQEVNPGGAIVANISYYFPEQKLDHPLVLLGIRVVLLYIKFKSVCGKIADVRDKGLPFTKPEDPLKIGRKVDDGLKPGIKTERRG